MCPVPADAAAAIVLPDVLSALRDTTITMGDVLIVNSIVLPASPLQRVELV